MSGFVLRGLFAVVALALLLMSSGCPLCPGGRGESACCDAGEELCGSSGGDYGESCCSPDQVCVSCEYGSFCSSPESTDCPEGDDDSAAR